MAESTFRLGLWHLASGDTAQGVVALRRAWRMFQPTVARHPDAIVAFGLAEASFRSGKQAMGLRYLKDGLVAARNPIKAEMLRWARPWLSRLFDRALGADIESQLTRQLIRRFEVAAPFDAGMEWPWPVRIQTLGRFRLIGSGTSESKGRAQFRQYQLLKLLVCHGERPVSVHAAGEWLWPDADGDRAQNSLKVTVHRLRRMLGQAAIRLHDGKLSLNPEVCWVDAWAFCAALDARNIQDDDAARWRAVSLYRGQFLPEDSYPWVLHERKRLRQKWLSAVGSIGKALEASGAGDEAMDLYMQCLDVEPDAELPALRPI